MENSDEDEQPKQQSNERNPGSLGCLTSQPRKVNKIDYGDNVSGSKKIARKSKNKKGSMCATCISSRYLRFVLC